MEALDCQSVVFSKEGLFFKGVPFRNFQKWVTLDGCFWTVQGSFFWYNSIFSAGVFLLYSRQRSYGNSKTSHVRTYSPQNKYYVKQNQKMGSPVNKSAHRPEPIVQSLASRVQRSKLLSRVQEFRYALNIYTVSFSLISLEWKTDCIARNNHNVIRTSLYLLPFININDCFSEHHLLETYGEQSGFLLSVPFIIPPDLVSTHQHNVPFNKHCFTMKVPSTSLHSGR